jgi:hypothetical protein
MGVVADICAKNAIVAFGDSDRYTIPNLGLIAMTEMLTAEGYVQTKEKLVDLQARLAEVEKRTGLSTWHLASVRRSYSSQIREYLQDIRLFEVKHGRGSG